MSSRPVKLVVGDLYVLRMQWNEVDVGTLFEVTESAAWSTDAFGDPMLTLRTWSTDWVGTRWWFASDFPTHLLELASEADLAAYELRIER